MPILRGSVSFARFRADPGDKRPADFKRWLLKGLATHAFEPLDRKGDEDRAAGFVELENPEATEFAVGDLFQGERVLFSWRIDQLRIPAGQLRAELDKWAQAFQGEQGRKPARVEKTERRNALRDAMRSQAVPLTRTHDVSWNIKTSELQVWSSSRKVVDEIVQALEVGLGLKLLQLSPGALASSSGIEDSKLGPTPALMGGAALEGAHGQA